MKEDARQAVDIEVIVEELEIDEDQLGRFVARLIERFQMGLLLSA